MQFLVMVKTKARLNKVEKLSGNIYKVWVTVTAKKGRANQAVISLLAKNLNIRENQVKIITGFKSRKKVIEIVH